MRFYKSSRTRRLIGVEYRNDGTYRALILNLWYWTAWLWSEGVEE